MKICDKCDAGKHRWCTGCDCALCPIVNRQPAPPKPKAVRTVTGVPIPKVPKAPKVPKEKVPFTVANGRKSRAKPKSQWKKRGPTGNKMPEPMQRAIMDSIAEGIPKIEIARRAGISRYQVFYLAKKLAAETTTV